MTPSSLLSFVFVAIFPFVALQIEDKSTDLKWTRKCLHFFKLLFYQSVFFLLLSLKFFGNNWTCTTCCWHWAFKMKTQWDPAQLLEQFRHSMCWFNSHADWPKPPLWCTCDCSNLPAVSHAQTSFPCRKLGGGNGRCWNIGKHVSKQLRVVRRRVKITKK